MRKKLKATCVSTVSTGGEGVWVLLRFDPPDNHFGESNEKGKLEQVKQYRVTIEDFNEGD